MTLQTSVPAASPEQPVQSSGVGPALQPAPAPGTNGSPLPRPSRLPRGQKGSRVLRFVLPAAALAVIVAAVGVYLFWFRGPQVRADLVTDKVECRDLQLKVVERGTLEAKENHDIKCEVKSGSRGAAKIKWVVDNGSFVKAGDLLVEIDDSYLQEQATAQKIARDKAETDMITAKENYPILVSAIGLAEQNLDKWVKGDFPQMKHDLEGQIQTADSNVLQQEDRTAWVGRMVKKGYMTASQEEAEQANLTSFRLTLQKVQEQKKVLIDYTDPVNQQTFKNAIQDAKNKEQAGKATLKSAKEVFEQQDALYQDLLKQIEQCKVRAMHEGIVVYAVPEQTQRGAGANQSIIAQGEPVQAGQKMMSIPDLSHMLVNVRIHEAFINHIKEGLPVSVRVSAVSGKVLRGHVKSVANVAAQQDWMSPDVKVYPAYVEIDENVRELKLKPGLSAECMIETEYQASHVLAVPIQAVLPPEGTGKPRCYVMTPRGPEAREIERGMSDEKYVEVKSGLREGEDIILNPRALLSDKDKKSVKEEGGPGAGKGQPNGKGKGKADGAGDRQPPDRK